MAITKFNYCMSHGKYGHLKSASHRYELGGQKNLGENSEHTFLVAWAVMLRDYYAHENPVFSQIMSKPKSRSKASGQHAPNDFQFQEWSIPIDSNLTGKNLIGYVCDTFNNQVSQLPTEATSQTAVFIRNYSKPREQRSPTERSQVLMKFKTEMLLMIEIFQESTVFDLYIDDQKKPEFQPEVVLESFAKLSWAITYEPDVNPCRLDVLSSLDKKRLTDLNSKISTRSPNDPVALHALIGNNYHRRMEETALTSTTERMTYAELGQQSAVIAHLLSSRGVKAGDSVGLCMDRTIFSIVSLLGILRAGAAYVPMDSFHPAGRIAQIVEKANIKYVVTDQAMSHKFQNLPVKLVMSSRSTNQIPPNWSEETSVDPSNPVYIMFTSGSTGTPKGVVHSHAAVSQSMLECIEEFKIDSSTRFMQGASLAFDASILEVFAPLVAGGCLCMPSQDERNGHLESAMRKMRVTDAWMTSGLTTQIQPRNLPDLQSLSVGGESPSKEALATWAPHVKFNNFYGLTEAGVWDTFKSCMKSDDDP